MYESKREGSLRAFSKIALGVQPVEIASPALAEDV